MTDATGTVATRLAAAGFVAPEVEAEELLTCAGGDAERLEALVRRRLTGEPLAWITGRTRFAGIEMTIHPGVYVPRWHSEGLALRAAQRLPADGVAVDLCTGSGAVAAVLAARRPAARVVAIDADAAAVRCARANGIDARCADLAAAPPPELAGAADVVTAIVPYVPTPELELLQRDTFEFEDALAYDGGPDGTRLLRAAIAAAAALLRGGGALLLELGARQPELLEDDLARYGFGTSEVLRDDFGDVRGIEATRRRDLA